MQQPPAPDAWTAFAVQVFTVNGLIIRAGEAIARPAGQSSARWQVLGRAYQPQTVPEMARDLGLARQSVQRVADVLAAEGLVVYRPHPTDRRTKLVELTPQGQRVLAEIHRRQVQWSEELLQSLDLEVLRATSSALEAVAEALRRNLDGDRHDRHHDRHAEKESSR
ncbi:MAG: MarR family transcriptional regulator [Pseudonocardiales bacterium]|nr:MarR family transcriptional regulator [Pseudonocardiales bacterium]